MVKDVCELPFYSHKHQGKTTNIRHRTNMERVVLDTCSKLRAGTWSADRAMKDEHDTGSQRQGARSSLGLGQGDGEEPIVF